VALTLDLIRGPRLDLILLSAQFLDALIAGDRSGAQKLVAFSLDDELFSGEPDDDAQFFEMRRDQVRRDASWAPWSLRAVVLRETNAMVGYANFHGPPGVNDSETPGAAEVGYTIFAAHRDRGFATETAGALLEWARREHGVTRFISGVAPDNLPSLRVNEKLGFAPTGEVVDGELIFELRLAPLEPQDRRPG
jgi:RimJ/RimL family protein N-acetyltransferase